MEVGAKMLRRREEKERGEGKKKTHIKSDAEDRLGFIQSMTTGTRFLFILKHMHHIPNKFAVIFFLKAISLSLSNNNKDR